MKVRNSEVGSMTVELVLLVPVVVMFALLAVGFGRYELARQQIIGAARAGAEAAAVVESPSEAPPAAQSAAAPGIQSLGHACVGLEVATDTTHFQPGGFVRVTVSCQVSFSDLLVPGLPGSAVVTAAQSAPIDPYRSVG